MRKAQQVDCDTEELVAQARTGDERAFENIYRAYSARVFSLCLRILADCMRAEELTQQIFLRAWVNLNSFRGESKFTTWLYRIAMNEARAVPVRTFVTVPFGVPPTIEVFVDADGKVLGPAIAPDDINNLEVTVSTAPQISYAILDKALEELQRRGTFHLRLSSMAYIFKAGQLFYQLHDQANAFLSQPGVNIQPPELDVDLNSLASKAATGGVEKPRLISTPFGTVVRPGLSYLVGINPAGEIMFVDRNPAAGTPDLPEIDTALRQAHVKRPAYLDGKTVPVAITIAIPVQ
jgi:hypothetical protein